MQIFNERRSFQIINIISITIRENYKSHDCYFKNIEL